MIKIGESKEVYRLRSRYKKEVSEGILILMEGKKTILEILDIILNIKTE
jgi:hypothetical protein